MNINRRLLKDGLHCDNECPFFTCVDEESFCTYVNGFLDWYDGEVALCEARLFHIFEKQKEYIEYRKSKK